MPLVKVRAKIEKDNLYGWLLIRVRAKKIESPFVLALSLLLGQKYTRLCVRSLVRVRAEIEKTPVLLGLWSGLGQKMERTHYEIGLLSMLVQI